MTGEASPPATRHHCPGAGCEAMVPANRLACRHHWYKVSAPTRRRVWDSYLTGDRGAHRAAMADAIEEMNREAR